MPLTNANPRSRRKHSNRLLIEARLNEGLTPNDLGLRAGVSGNTVRAAERGLYVGPRAQYAIAHALSKRPLELFPWERQKEAVAR